MNWASLYGGSEVAKQLTQYPDKRLMNAAAMLTPEERPTGPVRMIEPDPKKNLIFKHRPLTNAIAHRPTNTTFIANRDSISSEDPRWLAGLMGHEAEHLRRNDDVEGPAYAKQDNILDRLKYNGPYRMALQKMRAQR